MLKTIKKPSHKKIKRYFSDPELFKWVEGYWGTEKIYCFGRYYNSQDYIERLKESVLKPDGFDKDHIIVAFPPILHHVRDIDLWKLPTMGGINMGTGIPWINPSFPRLPSVETLENGVYLASDLLPDWKKSLFDLVR